MKEKYLLYMVALCLTLIALLSGSLLALQAQDGPPAGYLDSCNANPVMFEYFGPNCMNPVRWNDATIIPTQDISIGDWVWFTMPDGSTDGGVMMGYWWDFVESRYKYYVQVQIPNGNFGGAFDDIAPERVIAHG